MVNAEDKLMRLQFDRDKFETQLTVSYLHFLCNIIMFSLLKDAIV